MPDLTKDGLEKALRVREFCEHLTVTKGDYAGRPFKFLPWQWEDVVKPLFGTLKEDGFRQYRFCYLEIPKKSGKTPLSAVLGLYGLYADGEPAPEVYIAAADRNQAGYCFDYASQMVANEPTLMKYSKIVSSQKKIINKRNNGFLLVLSAEAYTKHGINPSFLLVDELHAHPDDELFYTLTSGTHYARRQQVVIIMSTAGEFNKEHIWWRTREKARQIRDGVLRQDNFLPVLYIADPEKDKWDDEAVWVKTNPSLGYLFDIKKMREEFEEIKNDPIAISKFKRFRLNMPENNISRWMPMDAWDRCGSPIDLEALKRLRCYGGLDMSTKVDLSAFVLVFPRQTGLDVPTVLCKFYCPEDTIIARSRSDRVHYNIWAERGEVVATPGDCIDEEFILRDIVGCAEDYNLVEVGFDPWAATSITTKLVNDHGINCVEMRQGAKTLSEPAKSLLVAVKQGGLNHGCHPVLRWCADNLVMVSDANENVRPAKDKATDRIDGMVSLIMAWGRMILSEQGDSVYEERGVTVLE